MKTKYFAVLLSGALTHWGARAHGGHGMVETAHWHATDTLGFVALGAVVAALWFIGKGK